MRFIKFFSQFNLLVCWNHIIKDTKEVLRKKGSSPTEQSLYSSHVKKLLDCKSEQEFLDLLNGTTSGNDCNDSNSENLNTGLRNVWFEGFKTYFDTCLYVY